MKFYFIKQNAINIMMHDSKLYETQFSDKLNCLNNPEILIYYTDHDIVLHRLASIGLDDPSVGWFSNYLSGRRQAVVADGVRSLQLQLVRVFHRGPSWVQFSVLLMFFSHPLRCSSLLCG